MKKENIYMNVLTAVANATLALLQDDVMMGTTDGISIYSTVEKQESTYTLFVEKAPCKVGREIGNPIVYHLQDFYGRYDFVEVKADEATNADKVARIFTAYLEGR